MKLRFEEDEYFLMAMFQKENRMKTMQEIRRIFPFIKEDAENAFTCKQYLIENGTAYRPGVFGNRF